jgi:tetratricopeptide (TPR) repeat protein
MRDAVLETTGRRRAALARVAAAGMLSDVDRFADPDGKATTAQALDHVETVIDLLVDANEFGAASDIYITWLGGYERLGKSLGAYDRGIRLVRRLLDALNASKVPIPRRGRANLISDLGLFLKNAGRVAEARSLLVTPDVGRVEPNQASVELQNASDIEVLAGRLPAAEEFAARALETSADAAIGANKARAFSLHYQASALAERGRLEGAAALLAESRTFQNRMDDVRRMQLYSNRAVCAARLLMRLGEFKRALRVADAAQKIHFKYAATFGRDIALTRLVLAEAQLGMGSVRAAAKDLSAGRDWTLASGNMELLVRCRSIEARMRLRTGDIAGSWAEAREMLAAATTCGFGLLEIDARNLVSEIALARDDATTARAESERALAASDTESCDYFWGRIAAHGILHDATLRLGDGAAASEHARRAKALGESVRLDEAAIKPLLP